MTAYVWDASNYDAPIRVADGLDGYWHKVAEGHQFYRDMAYAQSITNARALGITVLGGYFVNHPGTVDDQVDWYVQLLDQDSPWWRTYPTFVHVIDAEQFSYMTRAPNLAEIQGFGDRLVQVHGVNPASVLAYCPRWVYGDSLAGLTYRLVASDYGTNPVVHYPDGYPGDASTRWAAYSGQTPLLLQFGSNLTIGDQTTCDCNAFRGSAAELVAALGGSSQGGRKMHTLVPGLNGTMWLCDGTFVRELDATQLAHVRYIASQGAIQLWHDPATGSDVWNGGLVPAFGVDVATLVGGPSAPAVVDLAAIAKAVNDDAAARLAQ